MPVRASPRDEDLQVARAGVGGATCHRLPAGALLEGPSSDRARGQIQTSAAVHAVGGPATGASVVPSKATDVAVAEVDDQVGQSNEVRRRGVDLGAGGRAALPRGRGEVGAIQGHRRRALRVGDPSVQREGGTRGGELLRALEQQLRILLHSHLKGHPPRRSRREEDAEHNRVAQGHKCLGRTAAGRHDRQVRGRGCRRRCAIAASCGQRREAEQRSAAHARVA
mmetsp:Transcript_18641/g.37988  ORF Transcript_18641/g.37988 Transcript_18641/m.37988 type:complete len:224 (+) Transcript_18641:187-858(+)